MSDAYHTGLAGDEKTMSGIKLGGSSRQPSAPRIDNNLDLNSDAALSLCRFPTRDLDLIDECLAQASFTPALARRVHPDPQAPAKIETEQVHTSDSPLSLGHSVVAHNGFDPCNARTVVSHNFIPGLNHQGGLPIHLDPEPDYNKASSLLALPCLHKNEDCLTFPPQPGLVDYYKDIGLLHPDHNRIHVVWPDQERFRAGDYSSFEPLNMAHAQGLSFSDDYFVSAFTSPLIRENAVSIGLTPVQKSDSFDTNNKAAFRNAATKYGFKVLPGVELHSLADVMLAVEKFHNSPTWIKFSHSFGGDLVIPLQAPLTYEKLFNARQVIRNEVKKGLEFSGLENLTLAEFWPKNSFSPSWCSLLIEKDASCCGDIMVNGSNVMTVAKDGSVSVLGYFKQLTKNGMFQGSLAFDPAAEFGDIAKSDLEEQFRRIGVYCAEELKIHGVVGIDFMLLKSRNSQNARLQPVIIELNGRPPVSACSHIVADKIGATHWISRDVAAPFNLNTCSDFEDAVTVNGHNYARGNPEAGMVLPIMLNSLYGKTELGEPIVLSSSRTVKILIAAKSQQACSEILTDLERENGLDLNPY